MKMPGKVILFYVLTFVFTIILGGVQQVSGIDASKIILPQLAPGLAALIMLVIIKNDNLKLMITIKGTHPLKYIGAIVIPLIISAVLLLIYRQFIGQFSIPQPSANSVPVLLGGMLIGAFGEEVGWRGYLQRILEGKVNVLIASLLVGVLWGLWHFGNYHYGAVWMLFFILFTVAYSIIIGRYFQGTSYNVIIACLFHFAMNTGFYVLSEALADLRFMILNGIVWAAVAATIITLYRKDFLLTHKDNITE